VLRFAFFSLLCVSASGFAQDPAQRPANLPPTAPLQDQTTAKPVQDAEAAISKADWKTAEAQLDPWLIAHPTDATALFDAGYIADAQDRPDDAARLYRRAIEANPQSLEAHLSLGLLLGRQGKFEEARPELVTATTLEPGEAGAGLKAKAWRALARIDTKADPTEASSDLLEALKLSSETANDTLLAANLADQAGQYEEAEAAYRRVLAMDPKSADANAGLAHLLIAHKHFPEAETMLRAALEQIPDEPALSAQLATVLAAQDKAEALPVLEKLHRAQPNDKDVTRMLAEVRSEAGDAAGSDNLYAELLTANPNDPVLLVAHGQNLTHLGKHAEAFTAFDKATKLDPANAEGWSGLAYAASRTNQPNITVHALTMRSKYLAEVPGTYFLWATAYDTLHDKVAAASYYHHFLEASAGKFPNQEWQARQRLKLLEGKQ